MTPSFVIYNWLTTGSDPKIGVQLFATYINPSPILIRILSKVPETHLHMLRAALTRYMGQHALVAPIDSIARQTELTELKNELEYLREQNDELQSENEDLQADNEELNNVSQQLKQNPPPTSNEPVKPKKTLRDQYPFLADADCPPQLKILAADKITAYNKVVEYYDRLQSSSTEAQQLHNVSSLVHWYKRNNEIKREFNHYRDNKTLLGEHTIFEEYNSLQDLQSLNALQLSDLKNLTEQNIRSLTKQIKKNNRPDLQIRREEKLSKYRVKLNQIITLLQR
ncbi:hypothetical protein ACR78H_25125 [Sphingobacterium siyangense]|uniref:hypothetical protein n=1 Tax=Sphingobacterium siyangense TaxID=459529 RepID=UPI003DA309C3